MPLLNTCDRYAAGFTYPELLLSPLLPRRVRRPRPTPFILSTNGPDPLRSKSSPSAPGPYPAWTPVPPRPPDNSFWNLRSRLAFPPRDSIRALASSRVNRVNRPVSTKDFPARGFNPTVFCPFRLDPALQQFGHHFLILGVVKESPDTAGHLGTDFPDGLKLLFPGRAQGLQGAEMSRPGWRPHALPTKRMPRA